MEQTFASLSKRQTMQLLTAVTFGGADCLVALDHLPESEAELLKYRAAEMLQMPREKRIPLLVQEIKRLINARRRQLAGADADRLSNILGAERPSMIEVVLRALPASLADPVREKLAKPEFVLAKEVKPEILSIVKWKLEERLARDLRKANVFRFSDVLILSARELLTLSDRMGARALATSLAGIPEADRTAFLAALPPDQRDLATRAADAGKTRPLPEEDARAVLNLHGALANPSAGMRSAGVQRLARACLAQSTDFAAKMVEKHPGDLGKLFARWLEQERKRPIRADGGRADLVDQLERLAEKGLIDRPMRLPPPNVAPPRERSVRRDPLPGGKILPPAPRPTQAPRSVAAAPAPAPLLLPKPPRAASQPGRPAAPRDFMAERAARRAGMPASRAAPAAKPVLKAPATPMAEVPRLKGTSARHLRRAGDFDASDDTSPHEGGPPGTPTDTGPVRRSRGRSS